MIFFYSGNILIDLLMNFFFAIPEMIGLLVVGMQTLFNIDGYFYAMIEGFAGVVMTSLYIIGLLQLLNTIRGRGVIT